nr:Spy/CpxP family protein refolding chaperone [Hephaestia mangrovi]
MRPVAGEITANRALAHDRDAGLSAGSSLFWSTDQEKPSMRLSVLPIALALGIAAPAVAAQPPRPPATAQHEDPIARRADDLAMLLSLDAGQRQSLAAWLTANRTPESPPSPAGDHADQQGLPRHPQGGPGGDIDGPPPEKSFDERLADMQRHAGDENGRVDALKAFYASLNPEQKDRFGAYLRLSHDPMFGPGPRAQRGPAPDGPGDGPEGAPPPPQHG